MNLSFRRDDEIQNCTVKDQRPSVSVHAKIRSDQQTDKTGSIMSPKRRTLREPRSPRVSGTSKVIAFHQASKKIYAITQNF